MKVYRITKTTYASDLSGTGSAIFGGRWNNVGTPVVYTGENIEIALLESIVHLPPTLMPRLSLVTIDIPENSIKHYTKKDLPDEWYNYPAPKILADYAEEWIDKNEHLVLKVPSAIVHSTHLFILNCRHPLFREVKILSIEDFKIDSRFIQR